MMDDCRKLVAMVTCYMVEAEMRTIVRNGTHSIDLVLHWYDIWNIIKGLLR